MNSPLQCYQAVDLASRIESATPHALVAMLYDELGLSIDIILRAVETGDSTRAMRAHERAAAILHRLETGLDAVRGGGLAQALARIYRQMRNRLAVARTGDISALAELRDGVESLATAWAGVGG